MGIEAKEQNIMVLGDSAVYEHNGVEKYDDGEYQQRIVSNHDASNVVVACPSNEVTVWR